MSTEKKADFSDVKEGFATSGEVKQAPDFSNVKEGFAVSGQMEDVTPVTETTYTVEKGDTLSKIAKEHLGSANAWKQIFEANRDVIDDPDRIFPGQVIKLPPKPSDA
ncbi:LysM peptidoglycan-binding domain-containing protein [Pseudoxanthomonas sp. PXM03]|jgi:nucleoid-associated protein YgaU|uniref:LysM peptidoglycan-binding domain-containing protein n=1 Tax=Pseudoxanthomonas sp. PXM03 TaxID=2769284 RepID=UPI00177EDDAB|nr:LysM peptidoglycan-binding domain-containing protein [Pseudoxanthomonas sp. PXM03]MBD9437897.1 LysM peptidoglycan-binding domain-containing protein [Pseudoxanthomonas sp. PXM03]